MTAMLSDVKTFIFEGDILEKSLVKNTSLSYGIVVCYLCFVQWLGPAMMKNRRAFDLKYVMIVYDFTQAFVNAYLTCNMFINAWLYWPIHCNFQNNTENPAVMEKLLRFGWYVYLVKFADLLDTCMFVLRKKSNQVSFLHVFHHCLMCVFCCWFIPQLQSMGFYVIFGLGINTSVHVVVYTYYGIAAFGPHMNKYLWWKEYLTLFQMVQFILILGYLSYGFVSGCEMMGPKEISVFVYIFVILILFIDFYRSYGRVKEC